MGISEEEELKREFRDCISLLQGCMKKMKEEKKFVVLCRMWVE
jgi:adenosyl cobinamide kinase/adenosyl cobinamide phosphate guanylyltransferase